MLDKDGTRDFTSATPGTRFCGDITYLRTSSGWLYLATVIDLCTRMMVDWSTASHIRTTLIIDALEMARDHGHFDKNGAIFHSDRSSQDEFNWSNQHRLVRSMINALPTPRWGFSSQGFCAVGR
ncbi:DDE-type integrase/transposase/recombinase [Cryobacterium sp. Y50]|nr:DDE-type integrase/transposase/recombinase [Cryobacterium sp. Y50]